MPRPAEPGRQVLIAAAVRLLNDGDDPDLSRLSVNNIVAEAKRSKGAFYQHWPDRSSFLVDVHKQFHDELEAAVSAAIGGMDPGLDRLSAGLAAYWDGCLRSRRTKSLLVQARQDSALSAAVRARDDMFARTAEPDLLALGWNPPSSAALLVVQTADSVALLESRSGHRLPKMRSTLLEFVQRH